MQPTGHPIVETWANDPFNGPNDSGHFTVGLPVTTL